MNRIAVRMRNASQRIEKIALTCIKRYPMSEVPFNYDNLSCDEKAAWDALEKKVVQDRNGQWTTSAMTSEERDRLRRLRRRARRPPPHPLAEAMKRQPGDRSPGNLVQTAQNRSKPPETAHADEPEA